MSVLCRHATRHVVEAANRRTQVASVAELDLLACCVLVLQSAFEYLSRVLSRERVPKFNNSRDLKVCELPCKELLDSLCCQRCLTVKLHRGNERLAEFCIGNTKNCTIGHPGHSDQYLLYFGRIDVNATRHHQVCSPVANVEIPLVVEIADITYRDVSIVFDSLTIVFAIDISKTRRPEMSRINLSSYTRRHRIAVIVHNFDRYTLDGPPG